MNVGLWLGTFMGDFWGGLFMGDFGFCVLLSPESKVRQASVLTVPVGWFVFYRSATRRGPGFV